jgi:ankyrin repeat protein
MLAAQRGWYRIRLTDGRQGWVAGSIVQVVHPSRGPTPVGLDTTLINAANQGDTDTVRTLLAQGANVNAVSSQGETALMFAVYNGHINTAQALLATGANVYAADDGGWTALILARRQGHTDIVRLLQRYGARQ